jgi:hypothetical protein
MTETLKPRPPDPMRLGTKRADSCGRPLLSAGKSWLLTRPLSMVCCQATPVGCGETLPKASAMPFRFRVISQAHMPLFYSP